VGKTRLGVHIGRSVGAAFPDGVWVLALADVTQPDLLAITVLSTLGKPGPAGSGIIEVTDHIGDQQLLLILDNCEHLTEVCAKLALDLLHGCPNARILATSREPLRIEGETVFRVPPLSVPEQGHLRAAGLASRFDAVALFVERASALSPASLENEVVEQDVIALCQRLDGLPLAIELAAAGTRLVPIGELTRWADDPSLGRLLGSRGAPPRHQTLQATMEYSLALCSTNAQLLWARLSVFRGGADLEAVVEVCTRGVLQETGVRSALAELVDKSIVTFDGSRYRMLETIRQFGRARLRELGEELVVQQAQCNQIADLAGEVDAGWFGPDQQALLGRVLADQANVRVALEFCLTETDTARLGLRIASSLWPFWIGSGLPSEGRHWLDRLLVADSRPAPERVAALWVNGFLTAVDGDIPAATASLEECRRLAAHLGDDAGAAHAMQKCGLIATLEGRLGDAVTDLEEAVRRERELDAGDPYLAMALIYLGTALCYQDEVDRASEALGEARALCLDHGDQLLLSWSLLLLGLAALIDHREQDAVVLVKDALTRKRALDDTLGVAYAVELLAWVAVDNDAERSARLLAAAEATSKPLGLHLAGSQRLLQWHAQYLQQARDVLGPRAFDAAMQYGQQLTGDQVIAYALGEIAKPVRGTSMAATDFPLTPREREIAKLVATGRTNREIAAELVISHRTVDTHLDHILTKLNFTSRTQIAALFAESAL